MGKDIIRLCLIAVILIVAEATLAPALLFHAPHTGIALNAYIAIGMGLVFFVAVSQRLDRDERRYLVEMQVGDLIINRGGRFARLRARLYAGMFIVIGIICWPATQFGLHSFRMLRFRRRLDSVLGMSAGLNLFPMETSVSLFVALAPAVLTVIAAHQQAPFVFAIKFLWIIIFAIFLKHLSSLVSGDTVQAKLRRGMDPVLLSYAVITLGDLIGLILCYNGLINWNAGSAFTVANVQVVFTQLLAFKDFVAVFEHPPDSVLAYCIGVSGLLWWLSLAQGLFQLKGYQRLPSDYLSLASSCILLGKEDRARTFLEAATVTTKLEYEMKGLNYAALGDFDKAAAFIKRALTQTDDVPVTDGYILLKMNAGLVQLRADQDRYYAFVDYGIAHGLTDIFLADAGVTFCSSGGNARAFSDYIKQKGLDRFGLTYICLKWMADEEREVLDLFESKKSGDAGPERALWLCLEALLWPARRNSDAETEKFIEHWSGAVLDEIRAIGVSLADDVDKCALVDILYSVRKYWATIGIELYNIDAVVVAIAQSLPDNEVTAGIRSMWPALAPAPAGQPASPVAAAMPLPAVAPA